MTEELNYLTDGRTVRSWLLSTDHKRISLLYLASITAFFFLGGVAVLLIRLNLVSPYGKLLTADDYNRLFTLHGVVMVWFFLIPSIPTVLGNFLVPLMIGAKDLAFPRLNLLSWYLFIIGGVFAIASLIAGGTDTGWTFYTPYSTAFADSHVILVVAGVFISGFSSILTGLNFIVTIHRLRVPGLTWFRLPLFLWSMYATSAILVLATPVLAITLVLIAVERIFGVGIFDPAIGGDPIFFQHLFWFYSHPAVYIMILPAMGVVSEVITCFSRRSIFGYRFVAFSSLAIAMFGFLVWGHHMFVSGQSMYGGLVFSIISFLVAIPSGIKVFNWTATLYKGRIYLQSPMIYVLGFIFLFIIGGLTGVFLATLAVDVHVHDTYFVVAHFHYIMVGGSVLAYIGGMHFWWPKMSGKLFPERWAKASALIIFLGFNVTFFPQFILGYQGMPRRYHSYPPEYRMLNIVSTLGTALLAFGYFAPLVYLGMGTFGKRRAGPNPWRATGLEWQTSSPPPTENFLEPPDISLQPYCYDVDDLTPPGWEE